MYKLRQFDLERFVEHEAHRLVTGDGGNGHRASEFQSLILSELLLGSCWLRARSMRERSR